MKSGTLSEIKKELEQTDPAQLIELCISLARYKKDNKEYLDYLLFLKHDKAAFIQEVKEETDRQFEGLNADSNLYHAKKSLQKILRIIGKYSKYLADKPAAVELLIYFCKKLNASGIPVQNSQRLINLRANQHKKIKTLIASLHPDLQNDYLKDLEEIF